MKIIKLLNDKMWQLWKKGNFKLAEKVGNYLQKLVMKESRKSWERFKAL